MQRPRKRIIKPKNCYFCKQHVEPDYKDVESLKRYISERGKLIGRMHSGVCQKHQRHLTKVVKQARFLAFLPFIVRPS